MVVVSGNTGSASLIGLVIRDSSSDGSGVKRGFGSKVGHQIRHKLRSV